MFRGRAIRSTISADGRLCLALETLEVAPPGDDEVVVRIEAAPVNPTDLGLMLGPADPATLVEEPVAGHAAASATVPPARLGSIRGRLGLNLPVGGEGAGIVVAAGRNVRALEGKRVGLLGDGTFADFCRVDARDVIPLPGGTSARDGAAMFINPLTALGMVETARREGHGAIVHTAAGSNLGRMLQRICLEDGIPLINIVRSQRQLEALRGIGASYVLDSSSPQFVSELTDSIAETGASIAFDAIGGGSLGSVILQAMERAALRSASGYNRYGSTVFKQLYVYGALDTAPIQLNRMAFGFEWSVSGWLLFPFLLRVGRDIEERLRRRIVDELTTTFASRYTRVVGLSEAVRPDVLHACRSLTTGEKILIDPTRS